MPKNKHNDQASFRGKISHVVFFLKFNMVHMFYIPEYQIWSYFDSLRHMCLKNCFGRSVLKKVTNDNKIYASGSFKDPGGPIGSIRVIHNHNTNFVSSPGFIAIQKTK